MSAVPDCSPGWVGGPSAGLGALLDRAGTAVDRLVAGAPLGELGEGDAAAVMAALTTLVGRLDGLRVKVAQAVGERELYGQRGARSLTGWLRADARVADDAWRLARLAGSAARLPKVTGLLEAGVVSLAQAATAAWQIAQLPEVPRCPEQAEPPADVDGAAPPVVDRGGDDPRWAGLWRAGDVPAAADDLFAGVLPGLDCGQVRQLGAHLREAADAQERAGEEYRAFARRGLRISRSLGGCGEITGRLHAEAAEQVIAAFEDLGAPAGPGDTRTKAQRWADAFIRLATTTAVGAGPCPESGGSNGGGPGASDATATPGGGAAANPVGPNPTAARSRGADGAPGSPGATAARDGGASDGPDEAVPAAAVSVRPRLVVTVPLATLLGEPMAPGATIVGPGTPLAAEAARRLACDAQIIRLVTSPPPWQPAAGGRPGTGPPSIGPPGIGPPGTCSRGTGPGGTGPPPQWSPTASLRDRLAAGIAQLPPPLAGPSAVLDIGRASPAWTSRQRDALTVQYGGRCAWPGCTAPIEVVHHLVHWADGGPTSITNAFPSCTYHHWLIHEGGWRIIKHPGNTITTIPPPPGWRPGTRYRHSAAVPEHTGPRSSGEQP